MSLVDVDEGRAELSMVLQPHHVNGLGIAHGGVICALADSALEYAANSRNHSTVAHHNMISYIAPAKVGDRLTARAREISLTGRSGIYDVRVTDPSGRLIAEMRGFSRAVGGHLFEE